jgi:hypothetical protein
LTTKTNPNGQPRKQLADQLDRLDGILDALSDGLNQAVQSAVEAAVERAVQGVLVELLRNPAARDILARAADPAAPPPETPETPEEGGTRRRPALWDAAGQRLRAAGRACAAGLKRSWRLVLAAGAGVAATAAWVGRTRIAVAATSVCGWVAGLAVAAVAALGRLLPAFAPCAV